MTSITKPDALFNTGDPEPEFLDDMLFYLLARAMAQASEPIHDVVNRRGLSVSEWRVLTTLHQNPLTVGVLATLMHLKQPTLTKIIDRMELAGFVERKPDKQDGRRVLVLLTDKGLALNRELVPLTKTYEERTLAGYTSEEKSALKETLRTLISRTE